MRQCELQGIEASSEIQFAARRVADENKKLRNLLIQQGVGEDDIETYLHTSPTTDPTMPYTNTSSSTVQILEQLLQTRKSCCADGNNPAPVNQGAADRGSSGSTGTVGTMGTVSSIWDPTFSQNTTSPHRDSGSWNYQTGNAASSAQAFMTPSASSASRASSVMSIAPASNRGTSHQHQRVSSLHTPRNMSPASNPSYQNNQTRYDYDAQLPSQYTNHQRTAHKHLQPLDTSQHQMYMPQPMSSNSNSCNFATDLIHNMSGYSDPNAIRADLGCAPGMECEVDNQLVFDVMDRYSGSGL